MAFAQCFQETHTLHAEAAKSAAEAVPEDPVRGGLLRDAHEAYDQAGERLHGELQQRQSAVAVEGPPNVTAAALEAQDALLASRIELYRWIQHLERGEPADEREHAADSALLAVHPPLVRFLNAASGALADNGFNP